MKLLSVLFLLFCSNSFALQDVKFYTFSHPSCKVSIHPGFGKDKDDENFKEALVSKLKEKGYKAFSLGNEKIIIPGDLHLKAKRTHMSGKLWKDCLVEVNIKMAKTNRALSSDKTLFEKQTKRALPRHTFKGKERCVRALADAFVHIPHCDLPK